MFIKKALEKLYEQRIMSILVEAGGTLNNAFIQEKVVDKLYQFIAPKILADNTGINFVHGCDRNDINDCNNLTITSTKLLKNDIMIIGNFKAE